MFGIVNALAGISTWVGGLLAARFGYKLAVAASVLTMYVTVFGALALAISGLLALIPVNPFTTLGMQFLPDAWAIKTGVTASLGSAVVVRSLDLWKGAYNSVAKVSA